jgi:hypothetical protein
MIILGHTGQKVTGGQGEEYKGLPQFAVLIKYN